MYVGIDIGGTKTAVGIGDREGVITDSEVFPTSTHPEEVLGECVGWLGTRVTMGEIHSVGVACPGPYDRRVRAMLQPPNMPGWHDFQLGTWFDERLECPVRIMNDANAGALAEWLWGGHDPESVLVFLTMSTGMGGGIVVDGRVLEGARGFAAEVGRIQLAEEGPVGFGARGTVEGSLSGPGLAQIAAQERLICEQNGEATGLLGSDHLDARTVCELAGSGDAAAQRVIDRATCRLGELLALLGNVLEPDVVVLGTIAAAHPALFVEPALRHARQGMIETVHDRMRLRVSTLEDRALKQAIAVAVQAQH